MDQNDVEAVPHHPAENESSAIKEPSRPFFGRRKKVVAAVVSIVLVAAIAVGVVVSIKPNKPSADGATVRTNQDVIDAQDEIDTEPSGESVDEPDDEPAELPWEEKPAEDVETPAEDVETPAEVIETPAEAVDDEALDIIIDVGYEAEYPEDTILDSGFEQREPEEEDIEPPELTFAEKVPINSDDMSIELADFKGPITDFIVTPDVSRIVTTSARTCPDQGGLWKMTLQTDNYPWETYWSLVDQQGQVVASGPPSGRNYARSTKYIGQMCLKAARYTMKLGDKNNDGFCCSYGQGKMVMKVNGKTVAESDANGFGMNEYSLEIEPASTNPPPTTPPPTKKPTKKPTKRPTLRPTVPDIVDASLKCVEITVVTDRYGKETSYKFTSIADNKDLITKKEGELMKSATSTETVCVVDGKYRLTVTDPFQGIQEGGYYSVVVDGEEVMFGNTFSGGSESHIIHVGYQPAMTNREREWLDAHNNRRKEFHVTNGKEEKKLVWSKELAEEASNWVDAITPNCKIIRQDNLKEGENISARSAGGNNRDEGPEPILTRWVDNKKDKAYPANQSMTQVLWRGSRYVGCSEKAIERANKTMCYVTICRYARAGNCAINQYADWQTATLSERTNCGPICPNGVCY